MSEVLYRKWRPRSLDQVVGQETITQTLRQAVVLGRIAHAYLFCGPRGTGKTSTARILAKAINCLAPQDGEPDNECEICVSMNEGRALDLIEIDAASNRGIDDIRNLSERIRFTPNTARYKVYIIDEVHMLTEQAFNALLKTLEEPPAHAVFVLATTEAHKVPLTIISRCQRFDFRRIPLERTVEKLAELCREEGLEVDEEALALIARSASGSLRDAENLLEQALVSYGSPMTEEHVRDMLDMGGEETALELAEHIVKKDIKEGLTLINQVLEQGNDLRQLHRAVTEYLRGVLLEKANAQTTLGYTEETTSRLKSLAESAEMEHLVRALQIFAKVDLRRDSSSPLPLELAMVESSNDAPAHVVYVPAAPVARENSNAYASPPRQQQQTPQYRPPAAASSPPRQAASQPAYSSAPQYTRRETSSSGAPSVVDNDIKEVARALRHVGKKFKLGALLNVCKEKEVADGVIILKFTHVSNKERMEEEIENPESRKALVDAFEKVMGEPYEVKMATLNGGNGAVTNRPSQQSALVRAAQQMGARVVDEKEDIKNGEPKDDEAGAATPAAHDEASRGA